MSPEQKAFLNLRTFPARLSSQQTSYLLNLAEHEVPLFAAKGFLKPLGKPQPNHTRWFALAEVMRLYNDEKLLARATDAVRAHWRQKNQRNTDFQPPQLAGGVT